MNLNEKKISSLGTSFNYFFNKVGEVKISAVVKTTLIFVIIILVTLGFNMAINKSSSEILLKNIIENRQKNDNEKNDMSIRDMVSPKIQNRLVSMVYTLGCDRAFVIELHNGKKNATELPFKYFDMTYEEVNENRHVKHISDNFTDIMTTHYKLPYYLAAKTYFFGNAEELRKIDKRFAENFEDGNGSYLAMMTIRVSGEEIGFLGVAYEDKMAEIDNERLKRIMERESMVIRDLLDLSTQKAIIHLLDNE